FGCPALLALAGGCATRPRRGGPSGLATRSSNSARLKTPATAALLGGSHARCRQLAASPSRVRRGRFRSRLPLASLRYPPAPAPPPGPRRSPRATARRSNSPTRLLWLAARRQQPRARGPSLVHSLARHGGSPPVLRLA